MSSVIREFPTRNGADELCGLRRFAEEACTHAVVDGKLGSADDVVGDPRRVLRNQWHGADTPLVSFWTLLLKYLSQPLAACVNYRRITVVCGGVIMPGN